MSLRMLIILCSFGVRFSECDTNSSQDDDTSIVKGVRAREGQYPFVVFINLQHRNKEVGGQACTGSILTKVWVLTASHCFKPFFDEETKYEMVDLEFKITAGVVDYSKWSHNMQARFAGRVIRIPRKEDSTLNYVYNNDIAIIEVTVEFEFNTYVRPVRLAKRPLPHDKEIKCLVIGFGHFENPPSEETPLSNTLLHYTYVRLPAEEFECRRLVKLSGKNYPLQHINGSQICIHPIKWDNAPCNGDSGGPLICNKLQVGVHSGRDNVDRYKYPHCGTEGNFGVYEFPGWYEAWFRKHIPKLPAFKYMDSSTVRRSIVSVSNSASVKGGTAQTVCILSLVWMILPENI